MAKADLSAQLRKRMSATQQASELQAGDDAYQKIFQAPMPVNNSRICKLPLHQLVPFHTADIGFKPYPETKLKAFAEDLKENGLLIRIIVRPEPDGEHYEILAGHNRTNGARLAGWDEIDAEIVEADDARAITIATSTNLIQRHDLSVIERGKAYKALLDAKNRNGQRSATTQSFGEIRQSSKESTSGEFRTKYNARELVAEFFGVTEYEIRKAVKLTRLIPELQDILENSPKLLNLSCADMIADYDPASQEVFAELCQSRGTHLDMATVKYIVSKCPPPTQDAESIKTAWQEAQARSAQQKAAPSKKITFDRRKFAPYLSNIKNDAELEALFLEFLQERVH